MRARLVNTWIKGSLLVSRGDDDPDQAAASDRAPTRQPLGKRKASTSTPGDRDSETEKKKRRRKIPSGKGVTRTGGR